MLVSSSSLLQAPGWAHVSKRKSRAIPEVCFWPVEPLLRPSIEHVGRMVPCEAQILPHLRPASHHECDCCRCILSIPTADHQAERAPMVRPHPTDVTWPHAEIGACPFVDRNHNCCRNHFSMSQLDQVMDTCFGDFHSCPNHWELRSRGESSVDSPTPVIITLRRHLVYEELRPTGS